MTISWLNQHFPEPIDVGAFGQSVVPVERRATGSGWVRFFHLGHVYAKHPKAHLVTLLMMGSIFFANLNVATAVDGATNGYPRELFPYTNEISLANPEVQYQLGLNYATGIGVPKDDEKAAKWYQTAANNGNVHSQFAMGIIYGRGKGVTKDLTKSIKWLSMAATNGSSDAMALLGYYYYWGKGTHRDITNAFLWYKKAAILGNVQAQTATALFFYMGSNKKADQKEAIELLHRAACHWYPQAQYFLAIYLGKGVGIERDGIEAYKWASLAADNGYDYADGLRGVIKDEEKLNSNQIAEALRRAKEFSRTNPVQSENVHMPDIIDVNGLYEYIRTANN